MNLDEAQRQKVKAWIAEGMKLSEIQNRLASELDVRMTYMEVRMLIDDLKLQPKDVERPAVDKLAAAKAASPSPAGDTLAPASGSSSDPSPMAAAGSTVGGGVSVSVDHVARPGALVSGKVTFSDGKRSDWQLDQFGRLAVVPPEPGYKPSQTDLMEFQTALQNELARMGL